MTARYNSATAVNVSGSHSFTKQRFSYCFVLVFFLHPLTEANLTQSVLLSSNHVCARNGKLTINIGFPTLKMPENFYSIYHLKTFSIQNLLVPVHLT